MNKNFENMSIVNQVQRRLKRIIELNQMLDSQTIADYTVNKQTKIASNIQIRYMTETEAYDAMQQKVKLLKELNLK